MKFLLNQLCLLAFLMVFVTLACSDDKKDRDNSAPITSEEPVDNEEDDNEEIEVVSDPVEVQDNQAVQIPASDRQTQLPLVFKASDAFEEGRYLSEHLLIIQAHEESCFKLEVQADIDNIEGIIPTEAGSEKSPEFCRGSTPKNDEEGEEGSNEGSEEESTDDEGSENIEEEQDSEQGAGEEETIDEGASALTLMSQTPDLCHQRLFRIKSRPGEDQLGEPFGLEPVVSKTAWLVYKTDGINVWADAEMGSPCFGGNPTNRGKTKLLLGSLIRSYSGAQDQIVLEHYQNIGDEAAKIYRRLTDLYGPVSDVNANGAVDIFITPEVNRLKFADLVTHKHDNFSSAVFVKPEDLAPFDNVANPSSNESEVVYLWANDPGGIFKYSQYPTANSLTSNYKKGYVAQQIMALIIANARMVSRQLQPEKLWLTQGLSLLASTYMAGNDYSFQYLADYLSTRHNYLSLTGNFSEEMAAKGFRSRLGEATIGYRAMFAWFLHAKLCGQSIEPCERIRELVDTDKRGIENIETVLGQPLKEILAEFGHSVGVEMAPNKDQVKAILESQESGPVFHAMPGLQEVYPNEIPQTYEQDFNAERVEGSQDDRAFGGPFPGRDTIFHQPVLPDSNINLRLAENSVTYIILTGLIRKDTIATAFIGKHVSLTTMPLGNRDTSKRQVHIEKASEMAHLDLRPVNLTSEVNPDRTNYAPPVYANSYQVNKNRDLWVLGSIDNFNVNMVESNTSSAQKIGDVDSYSIEIDPCKGEDDEAACRAETSRSVLVQVVPREADRELVPALLVTQTSLEMFRSSRFLARTDDIDSEAFKDDSDNQVEHIACFSSAVYQDPASIDFSEFNKCANGGIFASNYQVEVCDQFPEACVFGMPAQAIAFNAYTSAFIKRGNPDFEPPMYDNFFHAGPQGFPFYNDRTLIYPNNSEAREGPRPFFKEEIHRQFLNFAYSLTVEEKGMITYQFHPMFAGADSFADVDLNEEIEILSTSEITSLVRLKSEISSVITPPTLSDEALESCSELGFAEVICDDPYTNRTQLTAAAKEYLNNKRISCVTNLGAITSKDDLYALCPGTELVKSTSISGIAEAVEVVPAWMDEDRFVVMHSGTAASYQTYYKPVFPAGGVDKSFCLGNALKDYVGLPGIDYQDPYGCLVHPGETTDTDIRTQLNMPASQFTIGCSGKLFASDFLACGDVYAREIAIREGSDAELVPSYNLVRFVGQRTRSFNPFRLARSAGEYVGKQGQLHYVSFEVPTDGPTMIHVVVGGLDKSQGKYLLRVKTKTLNLN